MHYFVSFTPQLGMNDVMVNAVLQLGLKRKTEDSGQV